MRKKYIWVLPVIISSTFIAGCTATGTKTATYESVVVAQEETSKEEPVEEKKKDDTKSNLEILFDLLGKDDAEAEKIFDGGKENIAADGVTKIGRTYSVKLFGEETEVGTLYDANNQVNVVTMQLKNPDAKIYETEIQEMYGKLTEINEEPSEGGSTWKSWNIGDIQLRLYQDYELSSLEITKAVNESKVENSDADEIFTDWLPKNVEKKMSETEPNELLRKAIIDYYEIPEEFWKETKYYYNYVDLNGDGTDEIFAVVIGSYTSGSGGNSALWCREYNGEMIVMQAFTLVNTPIIITKEALNGREYGARGIIMQRDTSGAKMEIVQLRSIDGEYTNVANADVLDNIDDIEGTAIICNNLIDDIENGNFLTLAE